jgi:hypothetical protein
MKLFPLFHETSTAARFPLFMALLSPAVGAADEIMACVIDVSQRGIGHRKGLFARGVHTKHVASNDRIRSHTDVDCAAYYVSITFAPFDYTYISYYTKILEI